MDYIESRNNPLTLYGNTNIPFPCKESNNFLYALAKELALYKYYIQIKPMCSNFDTFTVMTFWNFQTLT